MALTVEKLQQRERELDPAWILNTLPREPDRDRFLTDYRTTTREAAADPTRCQELRELLHRWWLIALATSKPGYEDGVEQAHTGAGEWIPMDEIIRRYHQAQQSNPA